MWRVVKRCWCFDMSDLVSWHGDISCTRDCQTDNWIPLFPVASHVYTNLAEQKLSGENSSGQCPKLRE